MFFNINKHEAPEYLCDLLPPSIQSTTTCPLRNGYDLTVPFLTLSQVILFPIDSQRMELDELRLFDFLTFEPVRNVAEISKFKRAIRDEDDRVSVPKLYEFGPRKYNTILTQLRCGASFLNFDLFKTTLNVLVMHRLKM